MCEKGVEELAEGDESYDDESKMPALWDIVLVIEDDKTLDLLSRKKANSTITYVRWLMQFTMILASHSPTCHPSTQSQPTMYERNRCADAGANSLTQ